MSAAEYEKLAKNGLRYAQRTGLIRVEGDTVCFTIPLRGPIPRNLQEYLRHLVNQHWYGSVTAPEAGSKPYEEVHWAISRGFELQVSVMFNLRTGELRVGP